MSQVFNKILQGDALEIVKTLPDNSINCIVTSPPYWGLRDYGTGNQLGLEETPEEYIAKLVKLFCELRRVLRDDGTCWLNLGDSFFGKQLQCLPWRVALALQADGWYLRSDIIWAKPNPMPESVTDRPTKAHEYIFLLTKSARYWYDQEAVREAHKPETKAYFDKYESKPFKGGSGGGTKANELKKAVFGRYRVGAGSRSEVVSRMNLSGRNIRSVWRIATKPYKEAHFAVFPPKLIEPCIRAGCPTKVCVKCGEPWVREVEIVGKLPKQKWGKIKKETAKMYSVGPMNRNGKGQYQTGGIVTGEYLNKKTIGFFPTCQCNADHKPGVVLDPFMGSGTTAQVAIENGCDWLGVELNPEYIELAEKRIQAAQPALFTL